MTLEIELKGRIFKTKVIWFSDYPHDVGGCHTAIFCDCKRKADLKGFECEEFTTLVIDLSQDLDTIWGHMEKSCRYKIRQAERKGIKIRLNQDYQAFFEMHESLLQEKGLPQNAVSPEFMRKYGTLFTAELDGDIVGGQLYLEDKENIRSLLAASKRFGADKERATYIGMGNRLIIGEAIKYAKEKGLKEFDMGGYYTGKAKNEEKEGINSFKDNFGGSLTRHYIYRKDYSKIVKVAQWILSREDPANQG